MEATEHDVLKVLKLAKKRSKPIHITHLFNVSKFHHRQISIVNFGMISKFPDMEEYADIIEPSVEIIGDFKHVHPWTIHQTLQSKESKKICFVTDCIMDGHASGTQQQATELILFQGQSVEYCGRKLVVSEDKQVLLEGTKTIAGSCTNQLEILHNLVFKLKVNSHRDQLPCLVLTIDKVPVVDAIAMLSENPAKFAQLIHVGTLEATKRADFLLLSDNLEIEGVYINGNKCYL